MIENTIKEINSVLSISDDDTFESMIFKLKLFELLEPFFYFYSNQKDID